MASNYWKSLSKTERAKLQSKVKRANEQYADIVRHIGEDGALAKQYEAKMQRFSTIPKIQVGGKTVEQFPRSKSGILKISSPSQFDEHDVHLLNQILKIPTLGQRRREVTEQYRRQGIDFEKTESGHISYEGLEEYEKKSQDVHEIIVHNRDALYKASTKLTQAVRRPWDEKLTIEEMNELIELYNRDFKVLPSKIDTKSMDEKERDRYAQKVLNEVGRN